jgi:DNA polymerase elongation subunit (family B)
VLTVPSANANFDLFDDSHDNDRRLNTNIADASDFIVDMREWDVPYHVRVLIDKGIPLQVDILVPTNTIRYPSWKMVFSRSSTRHHYCKVHGRTAAESRSSCHGIRY